MSLSLVAVFIPILLMGGIVGRLFREFAVTLSLAIAVSLMVSLTTTPMMCATLLTAHDQERHGRFYRASERWFDWLLGKYESTLKWVLRHQALTLCVTLLAMGATTYLYVIIPKGFFPQQDTGRLSGSIVANQDTSFQSMRKKMTELASTVGKDPGVDAVMGFNGGGFNGRPLNQGNMFITLNPLDQRKLSADQIIGRLRGQLARFPGVTLYMQPVQDVRVGGRSSNAQYRYTLESDNVEDLFVWGPRMLQKLKTLPGLLDLNSDQQDKGLQAGLAIDRAAAGRLGITTQVIDDVLYDAFGQRQVSTMYTPLNQYHVVLEVDPQFWQNPEGLKYIYVKTSGGTQVPLSAVTSYEPSTAPLVVTHLANFRRPLYPLI
jgi:multidrug efflux pump